MRNVLESMLNHIKAFFARLTKRERLRFGIIAGSIVLLAVVLAFLLNRTTYEILYEGLPAGQAGKVLEVLDGMEVPYRTQGGDTILVPSGMVTDLTMRLATTDTLRTDGFDPYIYSGLVNNMTTTEQDRRVYLQYTIGEFLKQVFVRNPNIEDALVMITLPER
ncbi:MAG: hypothetical protein LBC65_06000, partial [Oscillospiraceae bacterium]|nr:hypothetical protein [Oscillospiraceae bacterium]